LWLTIDLNTLYNQNITYQEEQLETEKRVRDEFLNMLSATSSIRVTTRYRKAATFLGTEPAWNAITSERYRQALYDDYIHDLAKKEKEQLRELRKQSMDRFAELLRSIPELTHRTTWKTAQELYTARPEYEDKERFRGMDKLDFLVVFEDHVKHLEQVESDQKARVADAKRRTYRKHRDAFKVCNIALKIQV
jgi:pre-mRNA-processing factor 40